MEIAGINSDLLVMGIGTAAIWLAALWSIMKARRQEPDDRRTRRD